MQNRELLVRTVIVTSIISFSVLLGAFILSRSGIYIQNLGSSLIQEGRLVNTISVSGKGKVYAKPDMVTLQLTLSETANTSSEALGKLNSKVTSLLDILRSKGLGENDLQTSNLSIYPEYDYSQNTSKVVGQRASQTVVVTVKALDAKGEKAAQIIDAVSVVENVNISSITFDIENKADLYSAAREDAFNEAKLKAEDLAGLSDVQLLKPVSIVDSSIDNSYTSPSAGIAEMADSLRAPTQVPTGELEISISVNVIFGIQ